MSTMEISMESSIKLKIEILFDPVLLEPLSFPKELKTWHWNDLGLPVFTVAKPLMVKPRSSLYVHQQKAENMFEFNLTLTDKTAISANGRLTSNKGLMSSLQKPVMSLDDVSCIGPFPY